MVNNTINSSFLAMTFINKIIILDLNKDFFFLFKSLSKHVGQKLEQTNIDEMKIN